MRNRLSVAPLSAPVLANRAGARGAEGGRVRFSDVVRVRSANQAKALALPLLSLQGIVNRKGPRLYVVWPEPLERFCWQWLEYYKSKGWVEAREITPREALAKYRKEAKGVVVFDPSVPETLNLAVSMSAARSLLVSPPEMVGFLSRLGHKVAEDLRGKFKDTSSVREYMARHILPVLNKRRFFLLPSTKPDGQRASFEVILLRGLLTDYAIAQRVPSLGLTPRREKRAMAEELLSLFSFLRRLDNFFWAMGYPYPHDLEPAFVRVVTKAGGVALLGSYFAANFSFHSWMGDRNRRLKQSRRERKIVYDPKKVYISIALCDLCFNSLQSRYYGLWDEASKADFPFSWWMDPIAMELCPAIVEYYYRTKHPSQIFFGANPGGRITPKFCENLEEYLKRGRPLAERADLRVVAFSNVGAVEDRRLFRLLSKNFPHAEGFIYAYIDDILPQCWFVNGKPFVGLRRELNITPPKYDLCERLSSWIRRHSERPLFLAIYVLISHKLRVEFLLREAKKLERTFPDQIVWVNGEEMMKLVRRHFLEQRCWGRGRRCWAC